MTPLVARSMPAIYTSFKPEAEDTKRTLQKKWYLAVMSCEETAYTLGAALGECRKQLADLDRKVAELKRAYHESRLGQTPGEKPGRLARRQSNANRLVSKANS